MNARELLDDLESGLIDEFMSAEVKAIYIRALRLLAAAESNDGTTPETDAHATPYNEDGADWIRADFARRLERERNGLAARVGELEAKVRLLNIFKGCAMDAIEAHEITNQGDSDVIGVLIGIAARSKP